MPEQKQTKNEPQEPQEKILPIPESERFSKEAMEALFGRKDTLTEDREQRMWNQLASHKGYEREKAFIESGLKNLGYRIFYAFADRLEKGEVLREQTRDALTKLREKIKPFFGTVGKTLRKETGLEGVAEELDTLAIKDFVEKLRQVNAEEVVNIIIEDQPFIQMLAELETGRPNAGKFKMLDENRPEHEYDDNMNRLYTFIQEDKDENSKPKSNQRKGLEASIWGLIVKKMNENQRVDLFSRFFRGREDVQSGRETMLALVKTGVLAKTDVVRILNRIPAPGHEPVKVTLADELEIGASKKELSKFDKELNEAEGNYAKTKKALAGAVEYMKRRIYGNPANEFLTFNKYIVAWNVVYAGFATAAINTFVEISSRWSQASGWKGKLAAIPKGIGGALKNEYVYAGALAAGVGLHGATDGWFGEKLLYSQSKESKESLAQKEKTEKLKGEFGKRPWLARYISDNYEEFLRRAKNHKAAGGEYGLLKRDIGLKRDFVLKLGFEDSKEGADQARKLIIDVFRMLAVDLGKKNLDDLRAYYANKLNIPPEFYKT